MVFVKKLEKITLDNMRKCYNCGETKDRHDGFHKKTSICKVCKSQANRERYVRGAAHVSTSDMLSIIEKMDDKMETTIGEMKKCMKKYVRRREFQSVTDDIRDRLEAMEYVMVKHDMYASDESF